MLHGSITTSPPPFYFKLTFYKDAPNRSSWLEAPSSFPLPCYLMGILRLIARCCSCYYCKVASPDLTAPSNVGEIPRLNSSSPNGARMCCSKVVESGFHCTGWKNNSWSLMLMGNDSSKPVKISLRKTFRVICWLIDGNTTHMTETGNMKSCLVFLISELKSSREMQIRNISSQRGNSSLVASLSLWWQSSGQPAPW